MNKEEYKPKKENVIGLAIDSLKDGPIHGLRHRIQDNNTGWYIWQGEYSTEKDFFKPICFEHLNKYLNQEIIDQLSLPEGYRFLIDLKNKHTDIWFDEKLLN
ncbi:MAG: immunity protein Imm33 domain-containing protein [Minisyncoccia bacterium]